MGFSAEIGGSLWIANSETLRRCIDSGSVADTARWSRNFRGVHRGSPAVILDFERDELHGIFTLGSRPKLDSDASPFWGRFPFFATLRMPFLDDIVPGASRALTECFAGVSPQAGACSKKVWREIVNLFGPGMTMGRSDPWNNQGRVRSDNPGPITRKGIRFRSVAEANLCDALQELGDILVMPLPLTLARGRRFEPDFMVVDGGNMYAFELDGPLHTETPVSAEHRIAPLRENGVVVIREEAWRCSDRSQARQCAKAMLARARKCAAA